VALKQELKHGEHEPNSRFDKPMLVASKVVAAKMTLFSSEWKAALYQ